jgi:hypothetical protein
VPGGETLAPIGGSELNDSKLHEISLAHPRTFSRGVAQQSVKKVRGVRDYL